MRTPATGHLSPADAELLRALYLERNRVDPSELARVRANAARQQVDTPDARRAERHAGHAA